jgi:hypothetical protein
MFEEGKKDEMLGKLQIKLGKSKAYKINFIIITQFIFPAHLYKYKKWLSVNCKSMFHGTDTLTPH